MQTYKYYFGFAALIVAAFHLAFGAWIVWMVYRVAIPSGGSWGRYVPIMVFNGVAMIALWLIGVWLLVLERRAFLSRKKFDLNTLRNIALAAYPGGSSLANLIDREVAIASIIAHMAWSGMTAKAIRRHDTTRGWIETAQAMDRKFHPAMLQNAITEVVEIYKGVPVKPFVKAPDPRDRDLNP